jgi:excisionase family DNA binding protein
MDIEIKDMIAAIGSAIGSALADRQAIIDAARQPPVYLSPEEVAGALKINEKTVRIYANEGRIKGHQVGVYWRFTPAQVREFVEKETNHV